MTSDIFPSVMTIAPARRLGPALVLMSALLTACGTGPGGAEDVGAIVGTLEIEAQASSPTLPSQSATVTEPASGTTAHTVTNGPLDYCFAYPEGFTQQTNDGQVEVIGPHSGSGPEPGLVWIDATDAQDRTAQDVANEEVNAVGGLHPRSTVMLGGEEALVLDGMPGQDAIRKVYIVHGGLLYTLSFSPYYSDNTTAMAQMETLFALVTSSWVWMSSGTPCVGGK